MCNRPNMRLTRMKELINTCQSLGILSCELSLHYRKRVHVNLRVFRYKWRFSQHLRGLSLNTPSFPGFVCFALHVLMPDSDLLPVIQYFDRLLKSTLKKRDPYAQMRYGYQPGKQNKPAADNKGVMNDIFVLTESCFDSSCLMKPIRAITIYHITVSISNS